MSGPVRLRLSVSGAVVLLVFISLVRPSTEQEYDDYQNGDQDEYEYDQGNVSSTAALFHPIATREGLQRAIQLRTYWRKSGDCYPKSMTVATLRMP